MNAVRILKMALYDPNEKTEALAAIGLRLPISLLAELDAVVRLWRMFARARNEETKQWDRSSVIRRFIRAGRDQAFQEFGGVPKDEAGWEELAKAIAKSVKKPR